MNTSTNTTASNRNATAIAITATACSTSHVIISRRMSTRSASAPVHGDSNVGAKSPASSSAATAKPSLVCSAT